MASSGRFRAASRNWRVRSPSCCTVSVPLRSCNRKLKPAEAPNPEIVGMLKGKMIASGMFATCRCTLSHDAAHVERFGMALVPRLQPDENRAEVGLVGARHHAVAADGRERVDAFSLGQDLLDL